MGHGPSTDGKDRFMKKFSIWGCALLVVAWGGAAEGYELEPGVNNAAVIE